jgi:Domain of unknown function (DUF4153)
MTDPTGATPHTPSSVGIVRAFIGLLQGLALYVLFDAFQIKGWAATHGPLFAAMLTTAIFAPLIVVTSLAHLRLPALAGWTIAVVLLCASLGYYDIVRDPISPPSTLRNLPSPQLWFALSFGLFVTHSLLIAGASDRRFIASYATHFDISWKYGLQIVLAALFAGVFWLILWLGAELFEIIKIDFLAELIQKDWFWIPATALVLNCAIHVTDIRAGIIRGVRTLSCNLLSWLLPLLTLIVAAFIAGLPATGLEQLWSTRHASFILLAAAAFLIFLINAAYQDGSQPDDGNLTKARPISRLSRIAMAIASIVLVPLVSLAAYGIMLRVGQYGWTPDRVYAAASTSIAACYAIGYIIALFRGRFLFPQLEAANVASAFLSLGVLLALFTPAVDPARISVADQVRLLSTGKIAPDRFDFMFLRFSSGRYGTDALQKLAEQSSSTAIAEKADAMRRWKTVYEARRAQPVERNNDITVVQPPGGSLPRKFLDMDWSTSTLQYLLPSCVLGRTKCEAVITDIDGDGVAEIILFPSPSGRAAVFAADGQNAWFYAGGLANSGCPGVRTAFFDGRFESVASTSKELSVGGQRLYLTPPVDCSATERSK